LVGTVTKDGKKLKVTAQVSGTQVQAPIIPEAPATHVHTDYDKEVLSKEAQTSEQHFEALKHDHRKLKAQHAIVLAERNQAVEVLESNDSLKALRGVHIVGWAIDHQHQRPFNLGR
jgi:hypothetical protein